MRILLASSASHVPPRGGSTRSNLAWLTQLCASGHVCRVVCGTIPAGTPEIAALVRREMEDQAGDSPAFEIHAEPDPVRRAALLKRQIAGFQPDWVLVSSEDIGQALLRGAHEAAPGRVVYLAHTPQFYPFGHASWNPSREGADLVARSAAVVAIGHRTAAYIRQYAVCEVQVIHPPIYGPGPFERDGSADGGFVLMINPCAVKGISIFLALAKKFSGQKFAALPGWGTTSDDRLRLEALPNVAMLRHSRDIRDVLRSTRILLMPSLWLEGFGLIVVEAMAHGIPVIASDSGGLVEAKLGTNFVVPVRSIQQYEASFDGQGLPVALVPEQDIAPWAAALETLSSDRGSYERESSASAEAARNFISSVRGPALEEFLTRLAPATPLAPPADTLSRLSPEKRALLLERLRARARGTDAL